MADEEPMEVSAPEALMTDFPTYSAVQDKIEIQDVSGSQQVMLGSQREDEPGCCVNNWCRKQGVIVEEIMAPLGKIRSSLFPPHTDDDVDSS